MGVTTATINERMRVACHEASHALVARTLGLHITEVKLGRRPGCNLFLGQGGDEQARAAAACEAGSLGEEACGFDPDRRGARLDRRQVRRLSLADEDASALCRWLDPAH
jgi:hypothetical protein